ncbi:molybdopterin cofactor-binding domain-containing protein [Actinomadura nitritigenes]|uniref:molybdopterin cofactor-binding domain-containing protein n=1 Tax=Actinomadura nitritigenes TaxID=134602 RepID=UPI0036741784
MAREPLETFEHALDVLYYEAFREKQARARAEGRYLGVGTCTYIEPTTSGVGVHATDGATIRIEPSGKVNVYVAGGSSGNSIETIVVQLAEDALGVDIADLNTVQGDTAVTPFGGGTGGSRSGSMTAGAIAETAPVLRERITAIAAHRLEASVGDIELSAGRARGARHAGRRAVLRRDRLDRLLPDRGPAARAPRSPAWRAGSPWRRS